MYAILDAACFPDAAAMFAAAEEIAGVGVTLVQYRNKCGNARRMVAEARDLRTRLGARVRLIMNDRADLCLAARFGGVHVGQDDLSPAGVRRLIGASRWLGVSTHNPEQAAAAEETSADYLAVGPVFATRSKHRPDPAVGLEAIRMARALVSKPLVAIGGITRQNCRSVIDAGADSVAVISDLIASPRAAAEDFLRLFSAY